MKYKHINSIVPKLTTCQIFLSTLCLEPGFGDAWEHPENKRQ